MMRQSYRTYIQEQLQRGYDAATLYKYMRSKGYDAAVLKRDFCAVLQTDQLFAYISNQIKSGFGAERLQTFLEKKGYDLKKVQFYISLLTPEKEKAKIPVKIIALSAAIICVVLIFVITAMILFSGGKEQQITFDYSVRLATDVLMVTDQLQLEYSLHNPEKKSIDVSLTHKVLDTAKRPIHVFQDTVSVEEDVSDTVYYSLPDIKPGSYTVYSIASSRGVLRTVEKSFTVESDEPEESEENFVEEYKDFIATIPEQEQVLSGDTSVDPDALNQFALPRQAVQKKGSVAAMQEALAGKDYAQGIVYCQDYEGFQQDNCHALLAKQTADKDACTKINDFLKRDECLLWMAIDKDDPSLCDLIQTADLTEECSILQN